MSPTGAPSPQRPAVPIRQRPSVTELSTAQLDELRSAFTAVQDKADERGYQFLAGIHGLPIPFYCDQAHGQPAFLPWHRAYLYRFELALRATGHDVALPWWDWIAVPRVPEQLEELVGEDNPLFAQPVNDVARAQGKKGEGNPEDQEEQSLASFTRTVRNEGRPGTRLPTKSQIEHLMTEYKDFVSFWQKLEDYHGNVHVWVGGHMGDIPFAAYDPIFWMHHAMIDRLWRMWQLRHPQASFPENVAVETMEPFNLTAREVLDPTTLGYDYATSATEIAVGG